MYKLMLAFRYLIKRRISYFSALAIALCVFVVLVVITVLSGLTRDFKTSTHNSVGDCVITSKSLVGFGYYQEFVDILNKQDFVQAVSPVIKSYALVNVTADWGKVAVYGDETAEIIGINPITYSKVTRFDKWIHYNKDNLPNVFKQNFDPNVPGCVPGINYLFKRDEKGNYNIADKLPKLKFEITSFPLTAKGMLQKAGLGEVTSKTFYYSDHVRSGVAKSDWRTIYLPFEQAQILCGMAGKNKRVNAIHIKFKPHTRLDNACVKVTQLWKNFTASKASERNANLLKKVTIQDWKTYSREIIASVETEQTMMMVIFGIIGVIMVFIIFVIFYMIISQKSKDIGILKSIGVSSSNVMAVYLNFAFLIGFFGASIGTLCGWRFLVHINQIEDWLFRHFGFQLWDRTMYAIGAIPNTIAPSVMMGIILSAVMTCLVGAIIPAWQAARLNPAQILQVNQL